MGLLKKSASGVLGSLSGFALTGLALFAPFALTYSVYAPGAKAPAAFPSIDSGQDWTGLFDQALACDDPGNWSDGIDALKILIYSTVLINPFSPTGPPCWPPPEYQTFVSISIA